MALKLDYDALRAQTMGSGSDEAVTVNTRALIDKVLARYSGEWTTLRELLQNAADAAASKVTIRFVSLPSATVPVPQSSEPSGRLKHVLLHHTLESMIVENNGDVFQDTDWSRLKKIAEGNPDETKIGAFGVGFYSVFADCEEPFVSSGKEALAFYWQKDALFTKKHALPNGQSTNTTFFLRMRNRTSPVPPLLSLCQFLTSSLTFVGLESIEVWLDDWKIASLEKKRAPSVDLEISKEVDRKTRDSFMNVTGITRESAQLDARWLKVVDWKPNAASSKYKDTASASAARSAPSSQSLRGFFSRLAPGASNHAAVEKAARDERHVQETLEEDLLGELTSTIFIHVNKALVRTSISQSFSLELQRATKKPPPKYTTVSLLSASYDEQVASSLAIGKASDAPKIFDTFIPTNGKGRIFIGFTTNQTTGLNVHISTPSVIPTVERESIDLNNRFVRNWNIELLRVAGIVARVSWGNDTQEIQDKLLRAAETVGRKQILREDINAVLPEALFLHNTFTWNESTPSPEVGTLMEEAFWTCNQKTTISTLSTRGILQSAKVRLPNEELGFIKNIPTLPVVLKGVGLVHKLIEYGVITDVTVSDIKSELEEGPLNGAQLQQFLEWLGHKARINEIDGAMIRSLLNAAVATDDGGGTGVKLIALEEIKRFLNVSIIPPELPIPPWTLPFKYIKKISKADLELLGFESLHIVPWLRWLLDNAGGRGVLSADCDLTTSPAFASSVLPVISKNFDGLSSTSKATVIEILKSRTVIPTKMGMKKPSDSYFPSVKLFDDLPVITGVNSVKDKFLAQLGVRKTVEIGVVFERLMDPARNTDSQIPKSSAQWSHVDLIKYLASVQGDIPPADINRLKGMKICPAEAESTNERYLVSELYEPDPAIKRLNLRTLQWPGVYRPESVEGKLLTLLGLRAAPTYLDLIKIMSTAAGNQDMEMRDRALRYFIDHHQTKGYAQFDHSSVTLPYLPIQGSEKRAATPNTCFSNGRAAIMGFDILRADLQVHAPKFGVKTDPPIEECITRLIKDPPQSKRDARQVFAYLATRLADIKEQHVEKLGNSLIIPVTLEPKGFDGSATESKRIKHIPPRLCFLGDGEKYADIFDYVDFGQDANAFLLRIGSKHEPSTVELTKLLAREPARVFSVLGDTRYLELLRGIATSWRVLRRDKTLLKDIKGSKCLLAYRELNSNSTKGENEDDEDSGIKTWELANASQIVVVDDVITYNLFKTSLLACPMEETLEDFYHSLGSLEVATLLEEYQSIGIVEKDETKALKLQQLIQERTRLFLHDYTRESIKHDAKWVEQNVRVKCVRSISLRKSLRGYNLSHTERRTAVLNHEKPILYITSGGYDMLEVSQALVPVLLQRSKPQSIFMLEMILESSLHKLRSRGYNVARLLNQKATEARVAEEARQQQLEEEQQELREQEAIWAKTQPLNVVKGQQQNSMPGLFPDSPDRPRPLNPATIEQDVLPERPRGFLSGIRKNLGFDHVHRSLSQNTAGSRANNAAIEPPPEDAPPPYSQSETQGQQSRGPEPEGVTAPHLLQVNLINAIQSSRSHNSSNVNSQPAVNEVKETQSYCDAKPGHQITLIGEVSSVKVFLSNSVIENGMTATTFLEANKSALELFALILQGCADVFTLKRNAIHIFYDAAGSTIAFNKNKSLFFNYRYFENLHLEGLLQQQQMHQSSSRANALVYWCVVMAHELAHNLVSDHSAQHSYYTEAMVVQYFAKIAAKIEGQRLSSPDGGASSSSRAADLLRPARQAARATSSSVLSVE